MVACKVQEMVKKIMEVTTTTTTLLVLCVAKYHHGVVAKYHHGVRGPDSIILCNSGRY